MLPYIYIFILALIGFAFAGLFLVLAHFLGPKNPTPKKTTTYECGVPVEGKLLGKFPVKFYLVVILFLIFDLEVVFLYPWAVQSKNLSLLFWLVEGLFFAVIILVGWFIAVRSGVLNWGEKGERGEEI